MVLSLQSLCELQDVQAVAYAAHTFTGITAEVHCRIGVACLVDTSRLHILIEHKMNNRCTLLLKISDNCSFSPTIKVKLKIAFQG